MKTKLILMLVSVVAWAASLSANSDSRTWRFADSSTLFAELVSYDQNSGEVLLLVDDSERRIFQIEDFTQFDQAWLVEWAEFSFDLNEKMQSLGGTYEHVVVEEKYATDLFIYYPSTYEADGTAPLMFLFHPGGKAARYLKRHMEAGEATGFVLVACGQFRNTGDDDQKEAEMQERFREILPKIEAYIPHDPHKLFMGGTSGGAWKSFHYSAYIDRPWAGIYSNVGWLGGVKYYDLDYPAMRVALVDGNQDNPLWIAPDTKILMKNGCEVGLFVFEGGHQVPPVEMQKKAFRWLLKDPMIQ